MSRADTRLDSLSVFRPKQLSFAISAALAFPAGVAVAQEGASDGLVLDEVIVTARKREESLQSVPASIQAISAQEIELAGFQDMDDYSRFIPALNTVQANPGTAMVIFRGIADAQNTFIAEPAAAVFSNCRRDIMGNATVFASSGFLSTHTFMASFVYQETPFGRAA